MIRNKKNRTILLIYPPITPKYAASRFDIPVPHIGIAYIGAFLDNSGYNIVIKDCPAEDIGLEELFDFLDNIKLDIVGISTYYYNSASVIRIIKRIKSCCNFLFIGGMLPTLSIASTLKVFRGIDCCIVGEGEITVYELAEAIENGRDWKKVDGIAYIDDENKVQINAKRKLVEDLDILPFPIRIKPKREGYTPILSSRGCYGNCTFCSIESYYETCIGRKVRMRNPVNVVDEIEDLVRNGHKKIKFNDENFNVSSLEGRKWFEKFYLEITRRNINAKYIMDMRVNEVIFGKKQIEKFAQIGLEFIFIGVESFIQEHLDFFDKHVKVKDNILAMQNLDDLKINYRIGLLLFNPITTLEDIAKSLTIIEKVYYRRPENLMKPISLFQPVIAVRGTPIYNYVVENNLYENNGRGYRMVDPEAERYYQIIKKWAQNVKIVYEERFLENELEIPKELFYKLYVIDLNVMKQVLKLIREMKNYETAEVEKIFEEGRNSIQDLTLDFNFAALDEK